MRRTGGGAAVVVVGVFAAVVAGCGRTDEPTVPPPLPPSCEPTTCQALGKNCGTVSDGCGGTLACGTCSGDETCGGAGAANVCGEGTCTPTTCAAEGKNCGSISDGCGGTLTCGTCSEGETCGGAGVANVCGEGVCTPTTCAAEGKNCGTISDGCGGALTCGSCSGAETCGGSGQENVCGAQSNDDDCVGLAPGSPGAPTGAFATDDTVSYQETTCGPGTTDGTGAIALPRSLHSDDWYFLNGRGDVLGRHGGDSYSLHPQATGFVGIVNWGVRGGFGVEVLSPRGEVRSTSSLSDDSSASGHRDPLGGVVVLERAASDRAVIRAFDAGGALRWSVEPSMEVFALGVDRRGHVLLVADGTARFGEGALAAAWITHEGRLGDVFEAGDRGEGSFELHPQVGGGLFLLRRNGSSSHWVRAFESLATSSSTAPGWLRDRPNTILQMARGGRAYAVVPAPGADPGCEQRIEIVAPSGKTCGSSSFGFGGGSCTLKDISVGYDGTVLQRLPEREEACVSKGHCRCAWRWWSRFLK